MRRPWMPPCLLACSNTAAAASLNRLAVLVSGPVTAVDWPSTRALGSIAAEAGCGLGCRAAGAPGAPVADAGWACAGLLPKPAASTPDPAAAPNAACSARRRVHFTLGTSQSPGASNADIAFPHLACRRQLGRVA